MDRRAQTPLRSDSIDGYLRTTRIGAVIAVALLVGAFIWDPIDDDFWAHHSLITGLVASLIIVALTVAVVNEAVERTQRRRWGVLAQYVLLELVRGARATWTLLMELAQLLDSDQDSAGWLAAGAEVVADNARMTEAVRAMLDDPQRRRSLQRTTQRISAIADELLGRWASVMLNAAPYAELVDRHVELYSRVAWVGNLLENFEPLDDDPGRRRLARSHPAVQMAPDIDDSWLSIAVTSIIQLAFELDQLSLQVAMRIAPVEWWQQRMGLSAAAPSSASAKAPS